MGKMNYMDKEPYYQWVKERVQQIKLPFSFEIPILSHTLEPTHVPIEEAKENKFIIYKIERENIELHLILNWVTL